MTTTIPENEYQDVEELSAKLRGERKLNSDKNTRIAELEEESAILKKNVRRISRDENRVRNELIRTIAENGELREQIGQTMAFIASFEDIMESKYTIDRLGDLVKCWRILKAQHLDDGKQEETK